MRKIKPFLIRSLFYLLIISLVPYLYFVIQAKKGIDAFIVTHTTGGEFEYQWLWINLSGNVSLEEVSYFLDSEEPLFTADTIEIIPPSIFDFLNAEERIIYNEYPSLVSIKLNHGESNQVKELFSLFNLHYTTDLLKYFYPKYCLDKLETQLPFIKFGINSTFQINLTADESLVNFDFSSKEFSQLSGSFKLNNFSQQINDSQYVSDLSLRFSEITWLQQNTQKCLQTLNLNKDDFDSLFTTFIAQKAKDNLLLINEKSAETYAKFIYAPQEIDILFNLQEGKKFSQIPFLPIEKYQQQTGLSIKLNKQKIDPVLGIEDPKKELIKLGHNTDSKNGTSKTKKIKLKLSKTGLTNYLGTKILILLKNDITIEGYLDSVNHQGIRIRQLKFKGESLLPFSFNDIDAIILLNAEH